LFYAWAAVSFFLCISDPGSLRFVCSCYERLEFEGMLL